MGSEFTFAKKDRLDVDNGPGNLVSVDSLGDDDLIQASTSAQVLPSAMVATIIKTIQLKSLAATSDYTCKL